jgi:hypothetical protein
VGFLGIDDFSSQSSDLSDFEPLAVFPPLVKTDESIRSVKLVFLHYQASPRDNIDYSLEESFKGTF